VELAKVGEALQDASVHSCVFDRQDIAAQKLG